MKSERIWIKIGEELCFVLALAFLLLPANWICGWIIASAVHELFHYLAIRLLGGNVTRITLSAGGAQMETTLLTPGAQCVCAFAGPVGGALLLLTAKQFPVVTLCAAAQTAFNLLPVFPLDGGRVAEYFLSCLLPGNKSRPVLRVLEWMVLLGLTMAGAFAAWVLRLGMIPLLTVGVLWFKNLRLKRTCKATTKWVQ